MVAEQQLCRAAHLGKPMKRIERVHRAAAQSALENRARHRVQDVGTLFHHVAQRRGALRDPWSVVQQTGDFQER